MNEARGFRVGTRLGVAFGSTGAALGLWFGIYGATASQQTLAVMWPIAGVFVVASVALPVVLAIWKSRWA